MRKLENILRYFQKEFLLASLCDKKEKLKNKIHKIKLI